MSSSPFFSKPMEAILVRAIRVDEKNRRHTRQTVSVGGGIAFLIQSHWKRDAVFARKLLRGLRVVLRYPQERNAVSSVALEETLKEGKRELAHRTRNLEERRDHGTSLQQGGKRIALAIQILQRKGRGDISGIDVGHLTIRVQDARYPFRQRHILSLT